MRLLATLVAAALVVGGCDAGAPHTHAAQAAAPAPSSTSVPPAPSRITVTTTSPQRPPAATPPPSGEAPAPAPTRTTEAARVTRTLRILPLGDSITWGLGDDELGSYRVALGEKLAAAGVEADFVGSLRSGPAGTDRDHEGHIGWRIAQVAAHADEWMATYRPDVVLLHLGTNDMRSDEKAAGAPERLSALIDRLLAADPRVRVFVAEIVGARDAKFDGEFQKRINAFNAQLPGVVAIKSDRVQLVDQHLVDGDYLADTFHPNRRGYRKMAATWFRELDPS